MLARCCLYLRHLHPFHDLIISLSLSYPGCHCSRCCVEPQRLHSKRAEQTPMGCSYFIRTTLMKWDTKAERWILYGPSWHTVAKAFEKPVPFYSILSLSLSLCVCVCVCVLVFYSLQHTHPSLCISALSFSHVARS